MHLSLVPKTPAPPLPELRDPKFKCYPPPTIKTPKNFIEKRIARNKADPRVYTVRPAPAELNMLLMGQRLFKEETLRETLVKVDQAMRQYRLLPEGAGTDDLDGSGRYVSWVETNLCTAGFRLEFNEKNRPRIVMVNTDVIPYLWPELKHVPFERMMSFTYSAAC